jgi:hypothetical protein
MDALPQICSKYKYLFFSVHLSNVEGFKTSIDKLVGRMTNGRVLTKPAFNLWPVEGKTICSAPDSGGIIRTAFCQLVEFTDINTVMIPQITDVTNQAFLIKVLFRCTETRRNRLKSPMSKH